MDGRNIFHSAREAGDIRNGMPHTYTNMLIHALPRQTRGRIRSAVCFRLRPGTDGTRFAGSIQNFSCAWVDPWLARHGLKDGTRFAGSIQTFSWAWVDPWLARHGLKDGARFAG